MAEIMLHTDDYRTEPETSAQPELPVLKSVRPLQAEDIRFRDDVLRDGNLLNFKFDPDSTLCEVFGVHNDIMKPGSLLGVYINYDLSAEKPENHLEVTLDADNAGGLEDFRYPLSAEELSVLLPEMDAYCRQNRGRSLAEWAKTYRAEELVKQERRTVHGKHHGKKNPER